MQPENKSIARCRHFGECGGCQFQDLSYDAQLSQKQAVLKEGFAAFWQEDIPLIPSPVRYHYRNKVDPGFALKRYPEPPPKDFKRETVLGFKTRQGWRWPLELDECLIGPEGLDRLFTALRPWREACGLDAYNSRANTGRLRNLLVRDGKRSGERMVVLLTTPGTLPHADAFVEAVVKGFDACSILHGEFGGKAEVATADTLTLLHGKEWITETLLPDLQAEAASAAGVPYENPGQYLAAEQRTEKALHFRISPLSFFQTIPLAAERLYGIIANWAKTVEAQLLYDLYGGAGGIAFCCAPYTPEIVSVENNVHASEDGRFNAVRNDIQNVEFITDTVRGFTKKLQQRGGMPAASAVVLDPPRAGMHPKSIKRILEMAPPHILYVSCNPRKLAEELSAFTESYRLTQLLGVDLFPHTPHVELVAALRLH
ncbi:MAG: class I SAM-dependent RNA methyltransferase [Candidatus Hydrogenedentes bacterium]|nr:class I SAM-dependent RNA methyltransferase [Candidatus Hydrogenedentota bacterium]